MGFGLLKPGSGVTGASGLKNVSPIKASCVLLIPATMNPTWPASLREKRKEDAFKYKLQEKNEQFLSKLIIL